MYGHRDEPDQEDAGPLAAELPPGVEQTGSDVRRLSQGQHKIKEEPVKMSCHLRKEKKKEGRKRGQKERKWGKRPEQVQIGKDRMPGRFYNIYFFMLSLSQMTQIRIRNEKGIVDL